MGLCVKNVSLKENYENNFPYNWNSNFAFQFFNNFKLYNKMDNTMKCNLKHCSNEITDINTFCSEHWNMLPESIKSDVMKQYLRNKNTGIAFDELQIQINRAKKYLLRVDKKSPYYVKI